MKTLITPLLTLAIAALPFLGNAQNGITIYTEPENLEYMDWSGYTDPFLPTVEMRLDAIFPNYTEQLNLDTTAAAFEFEVMFRLNGGTVQYLSFDPDETTFVDTACTLDDSFRPYAVMPGYTFGQSFEIGLKITVGHAWGPQDLEIVDEFYSDFIPIDVPTLITSISNQDQDIPFALYGNPTSDNFVIITDGPATTMIYNSAGVLIRVESLQGGRVTIDATDLPAGLYIVRTLTENNQLYVEKLTKK
jgi:hypothetical protein